MLKISDHVHQELVNWSRWCWLGEWPHPLPPTKCGSIESAYRAPVDVNFDESQEPPLPPTIRPHDASARIVQAVYDKLPNANRLVLKAEYPARQDSGRAEGRHVAARRLGVSLWAYESALDHACKRVEEAFAIFE